MALTLQTFAGFELGTLWEMEAADPGATVAEISHNDVETYSAHLQNGGLNTICTDEFTINNDLIIDFHIRFTNTDPRPSFTFWMVRDDKHVDVQLVLDDDVIKLYDANSVLVATSSEGVVSDNTWHYFEIRFTKHGTTGSIDVAVDENEVFSETGQDFEGAGTHGARHRERGRVAWPEGAMAPRPPVGAPPSTVGAPSPLPQHLGGTGWKTRFRHLRRGKARRRDHADMGRTRRPAMHLWTTFRGIWRGDLAVRRARSPIVVGIWPRLLDCGSRQLEVVGAMALRISTGVTPIGEIPRSLVPRRTRAISGDSCVCDRPPCRRIGL